MKLQWKLVIALLIGMLAIGNVVAIRYAAANHDEDMAVAQSEARDAVKFSQMAQTQWTTMNDNLKKMIMMPNGPDKEKAMGNLMQEQSNLYQSLLMAQIHCLNAIQHIYVHVDKQ